MLGLRSQLAVGISLLLIGCATTYQPSEGTFHESVLNNVSPAPDSMNPKATSPDGDPTLDPTYMASQGDFHYTMGEAMSLEGQQEKAIEEFKLTLVYDPNSVMVRLRIAQEHSKLGQFTEAIEQAQLATEIDPKSEEALLLLGGLYSALKMYDQALAKYHDLLLTHPENLEVPIYIGAILAEQQKYDEAIAHFTKLTLAKGNKEPERAYYYIGRIRAEQGGPAHLKEAEEAFNKALKAKPDYLDAVLVLSATLKEDGKEDASLRLLESYQEKFGPLKEVAKILVRTYLDKENQDDGKNYVKAYRQLEILEAFERDNLNVRIQMALILIEQRRFTEAAVRLEEILSMSPDLDKIRYYLGAVYEELQNPKMAVQNFAVVPPSSTYYTESVIHEAAQYRKMGQLKKAIEVVTAGIKYREDIHQFYAYYATLLDDDKQFKSAIGMLEKAVEKFPENAQLNFFLGSMYDRVGDSKNTIQTMKRVLEIDSDYVQALNYLAYTYADQEIELEEAETMARRALAMEPTDGYIMDTVGWVLFKRGKTDAAIRYLEAAYKVKSEEAIIVEHLADAYFRTQLLDKARSLYQKASEIETDTTKVSRLKAKLAATQKQLDNTSRLPASSSTNSNP